MVLAAIVMIGGFELLRNMEWLRLVFGQDFDPSLYRMLLFGIAMVGIMLWRPRGVHRLARAVDRAEREAHRRRPPHGEEGRA